MQSSDEADCSGVSQAEIPYLACLAICWTGIRRIACPKVCARLRQLLDRAMRQRSVGATAMNEQSSRSHMVFMLQLRGANELSGQRVSGAPACHVYWNAPRRTLDPACPASEAVKIKPEPVCHKPFGI